MNDISSDEPAMGMTEESDTDESEPREGKRQRPASEELRDDAEAGEADADDDVDAAGSEDNDRIVVEIDGDVIPLKPVGLGKRARISRDAVQADERGDNLGGLDAVVRMIDALIEHSPDEYDQEYWDDLDKETVKDAFQTLGQGSSSRSSGSGSGSSREHSDDR